MAETTDTQQIPAQSTTAEPNPNTANGSTSDGTVNTGTQREPFIPRERFDAVHEAKKAAEKERDDLRSQIEAANKAKDKAEKDAMAEQGKYKELYETANADLEKTKARAKEADDFEAVIKELVDAQLATAPEHIKELLAEFGSMKALRWLTANADKLNPKPAPNTNAGERGERGTVPVDPSKLLKPASY